MKIVILSLACFLLIIIWLIFGNGNGKFWNVNKNNNLVVHTNKKQNMNISSPVFENNSNIPAKYTCNGENINPALIFSNVPMEAKTLVLIVDDPDAPSGVWTHWTIYNMNPNVKGIFENSKPDSGIEGITSFGNIGYGGPCPPSGTHRYYFKLFALDTRLNLSKNAPISEILEKMTDHILAQADLLGLFKK